MNNNTKTLHFSNYRFNFKIFLHQLTLYGDNKIEKRAKISGLELNKPVFHFLLSFKLILKKKKKFLTGIKVTTLNLQIHTLI